MDSYMDSRTIIAASMDDFEVRQFSPTLPEQSGYTSNESDNSPIMTSRRSFSPPAWRKAGTGWFRHQPSLSPSRQLKHNGDGDKSREVSPEYQSADEDNHSDADDIEECGPSTNAARIPLPESPVHGRSPSPTPEPTIQRRRDIKSTSPFDANPFRATPPPLSSTRQETREKSDQINYIRFSTSLDVLQRTEPIEAVVTWLQSAAQSAKRSPSSMMTYAVLSILLLWLGQTLLSPPTYRDIPDLVKIANFAQSFEPAIYYSEHGNAQIEELHDTGIAVWDLGESVRNSNMTSAPVIVRQLDELSSSIETLAMELTQFFVNVDADIDGILLVMEWAQRELEAIPSTPPSRLGSVVSNAHSLVSKTGLLPAGQITLRLLGQTPDQRTRATLDKLFREFLDVLEESIRDELSAAMKLFGLFEAIDRQFQDLRRSTVREEDQQEQMEQDFLGGLWTKLIGANAGRLRKFQKNKDLLASVRDRTKRNKHTLKEHNQRLLVLKSNLETLRRRLVSPLVRDANSTQSVPQQIKGLNDVYTSLKKMRDDQKRKVMELSFGARRRQDGTRSIEAGL